MHHTVVSRSRFHFSWFLTTAGAAVLSSCTTATPPIDSAAFQGGRPEICAGSHLPVRTATRGSSPYVELEVAGKKGLFLIDYGASQSVLEEGVWQLPPKPGPRWSKLATPTAETIDLVAMGPHTIPGWTNVPMLNFQVEDRNLVVAGHGNQIGVLGVGDLLFNQSVEFHYENSANPYVVISAFGADCPAATLQEAGFLRIDQQGHWQQGTSAPNGIHNGPVAYISFESKASGGDPIGRTFAQIDTGLDDSVWDRTVIINRPLLDRLKASTTPPELQNTSEVIDCKGERRRQEVYLLPGHHLRVETEDGDLIRRVEPYHLIFQDSAPGCGGISGHSGTAAQLGASFLSEFGTTIFLGQRNEVWIRGDSD